MPLRELHRHRADAAGAAVHEQVLAGLQRGEVEDVAPDRAGDLGQAGGVQQRHPGGHGQQLPDGDGDLLGVAAAGEQRADLVADRPAGDALAERRRSAGALQAGVGRGAGRRGVEAAALQQVGPVDGGRDDVDEHLARARDGRVDVGEDERLGAAVGRQRDGAH